MNGSGVFATRRRAKQLTAIVAVVVVALAGALFVLSSGSAGEPVDRESSGAGASSSEAPAVAAMPDDMIYSADLDERVIETDYGEITVNGFDYVERAGVRTLGKDGAGDDGYVQVSLSVHNTSDEPIVFTPSQLSLEALASDDANPAPLSSSSTVAAAIQPGNDLNVQLDFLVSADETRMRLSYLGDDGTPNDKIDVSFANRD